ncbi:Uncharacterised protein [Legionella waltersii]|nr:Uncharacterised protein [Legionella waltersii]
MEIIYCLKITKIVLPFNNHALYYNTLFYLPEVSKHTLPSLQHLYHH